MAIEGKRGKWRGQCGKHGFPIVKPASIHSVTKILQQHCLKTQYVKFVLISVKQKFLGHWIYSIFSKSKPANSMKKKSLLSITFMT